MAWKKLFKKFQEGFLVNDHLWYLSGMKEEFLNHFLAWPSNQVSAHEDIWFGGRCCLKKIKIAV